MPKYAGIVIERPLTTIFHYIIPEPLQPLIQCGMRVNIPFGHTKTAGFVVSLQDNPPEDVPLNKLKPLRDLGKGEVLANKEVLELCRWIAQYYHCGWGEVLAAAVPVAVRKGTKKKTILKAAIKISIEEAQAEVEKLQKKAPKQAAALSALLMAGHPLKIPELEKLSGSNRSSINALDKKGIITLAVTEYHKELARVSEPKKEITLTAGQSYAVDTLCKNIENRKYGTFLLHGATASGKTEVYLRALEHCLKNGRTGIVLVPEISLTPQTVERFRSRVGDVAVLHSNMAAGERAEEWRRLRSGEVKVVVGARSAIFSPLPNLGLIVVDEEHERTFKQENTPRYNARDVAVVRALKCNASLILGSATPSLESFNNAKTGKYTLLSLPERVGGGSLPETEIVDMRQEWADAKRQTIISKKLEREVNLALSKKEQTILFLNRRGFNTWIQCKNCKDTLNCPDCDISLTFHRGENILRCHYCGYQSSVPKVCPSCSSPQLRFAGSGTEKVEDVINELFPTARLLRMDSDTMGARDSYAEALSAFANQEYDILLGTQMIAKGLDFPNVTVIGVLLADGSINLPDFRAPENTFQLITQVVGRAGRDGRIGKGIIQAYNPAHYAVQMAARQDYLEFVERELTDRKINKYPPFGRIARILIKGPSEEDAYLLSKEAASSLRKNAPPMRILGPVPCAISKIQTNFRFHILVKATTPKELETILKTGLSAIKAKGKLRLDVDIDPVSLL